MFLVSQLSSALSVNEAVISEFKAAADHYCSPLRDGRPLLIPHQTALCLSASALPRFFIKAQDTKQSVKRLKQQNEQRTTASLLLKNLQLSPLTNCNCPLLRGFLKQAKPHAYNKKQLQLFAAEAYNANA